MFVRDRIKIIYSLNVHVNFFKALVDGNRDGIDYINWDKETHLYSFTEILKELYSSREGHPWSRDEYNYLKDLIADGRGNLEIAKELNRDVFEIEQKAFDVEVSQIKYDEFNRSALGG